MQPFVLCKIFLQILPVKQLHHNVVSGFTSGGVFLLKRVEHLDDVRVVQCEGQFFAFENLPLVAALGRRYLSNPFDRNRLSRFDAFPPIDNTKSTPAYLLQDAITAHSKWAETPVGIGFTH